MSKTGNMSVSIVTKLVRPKNFGVVFRKQIECVSQNQKGAKNWGCSTKTVEQSHISQIRVFCSIINASPLINHSRSVNLDLGSKVEYNSNLPISDIVIYVAVLY